MADFRSPSKSIVPACGDVAFGSTTAIVTRGSMIATGVIMSAREELHRLLDRIPESDVPATQKFLRSLVNPVDLAILLAPEDDEPETEEERRAVKAALADPSPDIPFERVRRIQ